MTTGEKIIALRKQEGWSQEELSDRLDVSRQSISKWEGDLSAPGVDKLLELSRLFGVSIDYLLKEELESPDAAAPALEDRPAPPLRQVSLPEAETFLARKQAGARPIALATALCILSPVPLILLGGLAQFGRVREETAVVIGMVALFALVVPAVALFVSWGLKLGRYEYMEKELFTAAPGVEALARSRMEALAPARSRRLTAGVCLCVGAAIPLFAAMSADGLVYAVLFLAGGVGLLLALVAAGVYLIVSVSIPWGACQMLLQEGDYAPERKNPWRRALRAAYWCAVTAGYLVWSFVSQRWGSTWFVWPVAGVLYGAVDALLRLVSRRKR